MESQTVTMRRLRFDAAEESAAPEVEITVVMPCLNEAETIDVCIQKAMSALENHKLSGEVVIADNGSTDGSQAIARRRGARVVHIERKGYGSALMGGIAAARGRYVIMGDADDSYDFTNIMPFVEELRAGKQLVMGNRFKGEIKPGAMKALHRYLGNPVLTGIGRLFFRSSCGDFHCGLRGFDKSAIVDLDLRTTGMEFASEMVVKATLQKLRVSEVPTTLSPDGRSRPPHLRSWRDGWRHLRFLLLYSPRWLFLLPGIALLMVGVLAGLWLLPGARSIGGVGLDVSTLMYAAAAVIIGYQAVMFAMFTKAFAINAKLLPPDARLDRLFRVINLEKGLVVGAIMVLAGLGASLWAVNDWGQHEFGALDPQRALRVVIPSVVLLVLGCQTVLSSFFLSVLGMARR
ncbi:MAG TPA: glycosyltransferase family 2 protein [Pirellulales bacterium]|nr:glycosyltransferase family 2 protein [Pirellulales bacterium]